VPPYTEKQTTTATSDNIIDVIIIIINISIFLL